MERRGKASCPALGRLIGCGSVLEVGGPHVQDTGPRHSPFPGSQSCSDPSHPSIPVPSPPNSSMHPAPPGLGLPVTFPPVALTSEGPCPSKGAFSFF